MAEEPVHRLHIDRFDGVRFRPEEDLLAVEEPLEIRLRYRRAGAERERALAVTMRTPGADADLAAGFLFSEAVVRTPADIVALEAGAPARGQVLVVTLAPGVTFDEDRLNRHFYTTSSCGVCGKASLEAVRLAACPSLPGEGPVWPVERLRDLTARLEGAQPIFDRTGGLHAAALFAADGRLLLVREDVGRHNAVDKVIGAAFRAGLVPLHRHLLLVSGRAGLELVQKALMAGIPHMAAVGAPTSLAVRLARAFGLTLVGFLRKDRFNVYSGAWRLSTPTLEQITQPLILEA